MTLLMTQDMLFITLFCHAELKYTNIYLVFDRYYKYSIKGLKRDPRTGSIASNHVLSLSTPILKIEDTMVSTENKVQIIDIISNHLIEKLEKISYRNIFRR